MTVYVYVYDCLAHISNWVSEQGVWESYFLLLQGKLYIFFLSFLSDIFGNSIYLTFTKDLVYGSRILFQI